MSRSSSRPPAPARPADAPAPPPALTALTAPTPPTPPPAPTLWATALGAVTTTVALLVLVVLGQASGLLLMIAPLAATAMIVCASPALPPAQPRAVLLGQGVSAVVGLTAGALFGRSLWVAAVAAGLSAGLMGLLRAVHAPAAATAVLVVVQHPAPVRFLPLLVLGSVLIVLVGAAAARIGAIGRYPARWW
ncbi:HPP family protein [Kitasatospora sp. NBC_00240]|uniref:HPP family protein n=1 Tax=Kitasatospora sp. NBC_00240 TaxID=2903567 RepID=UPI0022594CEB|nr:HPP family protein [Kitasatospora sp. NBC_00240]MCX5211176.1 HPP family protein [Kitasatospora sp. NBC_00240]